MRGKMDSPSLEETASALPPATGGADLQAALAVVADSLLPRVPDQIDEGIDAMRSEAPAFFVVADSPVFMEAVLQSYSEHLVFVWNGLAKAPELRERLPPPLTVAEARTSAQLGVTLDAFLHSCRIGHRLMFEAAAHLIDSEIGDATVRKAALERVHSWLFAYFDWTMPLLSTAYRREREAQLQGGELRRRQLLRRLLAGETVEEWELGYALRQEHVAVVSWGAHAGQAITALARSTGASVLRTAGPQHAGLAWLGRDTFDLPAAQELTKILPVDTHVALGEAFSGIEGFRRSYRQALESYRVAKEFNLPSVTRFSEVELVALTTHDPRQTSEFIAGQLGPLAGTDERSQLLRDTLIAYFEAGQNAAAAASRLGINDRTVAYRVRRVEEQLGRSVLNCQERLSLALRLFQLVGPSTSDRS